MIFNEIISNGSTRGNKSYLSINFALFLIALFAITFLAAPLAILLVLILVSFSNMTYGVKKLLFNLLFPALLAILSIQKMPTSDLSAYIEGIHLISGLDFFSVLSFHFLSLRPSEFLFNYYIFFIAQVDKSGLLFLFLSTFSIYFLFIRALLILFSLIDNRKNIFLIILSVLFFSVTFTLVGHLIRQYLACAVLFYGLALLQSKENKSGWALILSSVFIHNSMAPFVVSLPIMLWVLKGRNILTTLIATIIIAIFISTKVDYIKPFMEIGFIKDDGSIPLALVALDIILFTVAFFIKYNEARKDRLDIILAFSLLQLGALISLHNVNLLFLRYYFINDFIRGYFILYIIMKLFSYKSFNLISFCLLILSVSVFILRTSFSPWDYGLDGGSLITLPFFHIIERVVDVWL
ncbi:MAG: EpsG family protein [Colwellia sp.]|nr:EpsG family protein [Colwellia sp.]MCW9082878.1 EpsG family protein [Colwellia sp.]